MRPGGFDQREAPGPTWFQTELLRESTEVTG